MFGSTLIAKITRCLFLTLILTTFYTEGKASYDILNLKPGLELKDAKEQLAKLFQNKNYKLYYLDSRAYFEQYLSKEFPGKCTPIAAGIQDALVLVANFQVIALYFDSRSPQKIVHTITRSIDLSRADITRDDVTLALEDKFSPGVGGGESRYWGKCKFDFNLLEQPTQRQEYSLAPSPEEVEHSRRQTDCINAGRWHNAEFTGPSENMASYDPPRHSIFIKGVTGTSDVAPDIPLARISNPEINYSSEPNAPKVKEIDGIVRLPGGVYFAPLNCGPIAYVYFFNETWPNITQHAFIVVSDTDLLQQNVSKGVRNAQIKSQKKGGRGDIPF